MKDSTTRTHEQPTLTRRQTADHLGLTAWEVETLEAMARLRLLQGLAQRYPQTLPELGVGQAGRRFLRTTVITPGNARRLWRQWRRLAIEDQGEGVPA